MQHSLECPHCEARYLGEGLETLRIHLQTIHPEERQEWLFLCAFCADNREEKEEIIQHILDKHLEELRTLPTSGVLQARERLLGLPPDLPMLPGERTNKAMPPPVDEEEEKVPQLLPPIAIHPPLPPEKHPQTPPPPQGKPPPVVSEEDQRSTRGRKVPSPKPSVED